MHLPEILGTLGISLPSGALDHLPQIQRASFGVGDSMFLVVMALIVFGPKKLPEISRQVGKLLFEFRKASNDFKLQIEEELRASEQVERQNQLNTQAATPQPATPVALSADETVGTDGGPTIMPPNEGEPVSSLPPNYSAREESEASAEASSATNTDSSTAPAHSGAFVMPELSSFDSSLQKTASTETASTETDIEDLQQAARAAEEDSMQHAAMAHAQENAATHHG
ncbi:MAG: Sec-independent protein translocase subunit TatA/TatB [Acidobacteriaceae bacterium]